MASFLITQTSNADSQGALAAFQFAQAVCQSQHQINMVFFYGSSVYATSFLRTPPTDEFDLTQAWIELAKQYGFRLVVCSAAGQRRGLLNDEEADYHGKSQFNLRSPFEIGGLGEFVQAQSQADRLIQF